jgi:hypothetical protein
MVSLIDVVAPQRESSTTLWAMNRLCVHHLITNGDLHQKRHHLRLIGHAPPQLHLLCPCQYTPWCIEGLWIKDLIERHTCITCLGRVENDYKC